MKLTKTPNTKLLPVPQRSSLAPIVEEPNTESKKLTKNPTTKGRPGPQRSSLAPIVEESNTEKQAFANLVKSYLQELKDVTASVKTSSKESIPRERMINRLKDLVSVLWKPQTSGGSMRLDGPAQTKGPILTELGTVLAEAERLLLLMLERAVQSEEKLFQNPSLNSYYAFICIRLAAVEEVAEACNAYTVRI